MVRVIDLDKGGLTAEQVHDSIQSPEGAILREGGRVIARLEPADEIDLDDETWAHDPEQVTRGAAARPVACARGCEPTTEARVRQVNPLIAGAPKVDRSM